VTKENSVILRFWAPVVIWAGVIFFLSSIPGKHIPKVGIPNIDKLVHSFEFFILGLLVIRAFINSYIEPSPLERSPVSVSRKRHNINLAKAIILSIIIASLYGASDEWHQSFVAGRTPDVLDFLVDFIGLNVGIFLYAWRGQKCR